MPIPFNALDEGGNPVLEMPPAAKARVGARTAASIVWLIASRLITKSIDLVLLLVLARLLVPADFGIVAIGMTLVQIVEAVLELPVFQVLVRLPELDHRHYDTAFTLSFARSLVLALVLSLLAIPFAKFYGDPRVLPVIIVLSIAPVSRGVGSPRMADFARAIDFRRDVALEITGKLVAFATATFVAVVTQSYWALVVGTVSAPLAMAMASFIFAPYRPRLSLFDWRTFAGFLGWTTAAQFVGAINWQLDRLLLGRFTNPTELGLYSMANDLSYLPEQAILRPIMRPLLSAFAAIGDDWERLARSYLRTSALVLAAGLPPIVGMCVLAEPAVRLALGPKWLSAVPIIQILGLTTIPPLFVAALGPLAAALGQTKIFFRQSIIELTVRVPLMTAGVAFAGVWGAVAMRVVAGAIMTVVAIWFANEIIRIPMRRQLAAAALPLLAGAVLALILLALRPLLADVTGLVLAVRLGLTGIAGLLGFVATIVAGWKWTGHRLGIESEILARLQALQCWPTRSAQPWRPSDSGRP